MTSLSVKNINCNMIAQALILILHGKEEFA